MKAVIAPNSFKGTISSVKAAEIIAATAENAGIYAEQIPVSDGGDGLVDVMLARFGGKKVYLRVEDALGSPVKGEYCLIDGGRTAVIEIAKACGLGLMGGRKLRPMEATSYGAGQLIADAFNRGARRIYVGLGGSATNDGGIGLACALGVKLCDRRGNPVGRGVGALKFLSSISMRGINPLVAQSEIYAVTDVSNPLLGRIGSARVYGPQKGADRRQVKQMADGLVRLSGVIKKDLRIDVGSIRGGGAAGGIAAGLVAFCGAEIVPGAEFVLESLGAEEYIKKCDFVVAGEGKLDRQTNFGKAPAAVCRLAAKHGKPVLFLAGRIELPKTVVKKMGITVAVSAQDAGFSGDEAIKKAPLCLKIQSRKGLLLIKDFLQRSR